MIRASAPARQILGELDRQLFAYRHKARVKQSIKGGTQTKTIAGIGSLAFVGPPGDDMTGYKAFLNGDTGNAARSIVATQHSFAKEPLLNPNLALCDLLCRARG